MDRTDRELAAWYRLHAQQAPSGPLRDIADPLDFLEGSRRCSSGAGSPPNASTGDPPSTHR